MYEGFGIIALEDFLDDKAHVLRQHRGASAEDAANAGFENIDFLGQRLEQLGRGEETADFAVLEDHRGLVDDVFHVGLRFVELLVRDQLLHPARIEVDEVAR